ncbi:hypothetical protein NMG60_11027033 [Bertholletia excelsa]
MAEKDQPVHPLAPANGLPRSGEETGALQYDEILKKRRRKCFAYIAAFAVFQTAIILLFAFTVMKFKSPKVRLGTVSVDNIVGSNSSLSMKLTGQVRVKNTNFGHYKFDDGIATITYEGTKVGQFIIPERRLRARTTKSIEFIVDLSFAGISNSSRLEGDLRSGVLNLSSQAKLNGKVQLMKVIKKKKRGEMSCTMAVNLSTKQVQDVNCK